MEKTAGGIEVAVEEPQAWQRRLTIRVTRDRVATVRAQERRQVAGSVRLKGFRKGKVPTQVVEQRFGSLVDERTVRTIVREAYGWALEEHGLRPVGEPRFGDVQYARDQDLTFQVELQVLPELRLERLGGFRLRRPDVAVSEEQIEEALERLRGERAVWHPVDRSPRPGDSVSVRILRVDGEGEREEPRPYRLELGAGFAIPQVEEAIQSLAPGEQREFEISYPEDFGDPDLAGSTGRLQIELLEVKERRLPALDDEFATQVGDFETLEALRDAVREDLRAHAEREAEERVRDELIDSLIQANPFEIPPAMVEQYLERILDRPGDADPRKLEEARSALRPVAESAIKRQLILEKVIELEGLEASPEEVEARIQELADRRGVSARELRRRLARGGGTDEIRHRIAVDKAFRYLLSLSEVA